MLRLSSASPRCLLLLRCKPMGDNGWIKLHRKLQAKGYYKNSQYVHLWVHLLLLANHKEHEYMHDGGMIMIKEGQLITGRKQLSAATGIPQTTIERILKLLENEHQIGQQKTNKYRLITILNWKEHQDRTPERTSNGHQTDTYKNDKNEKKNTSVANAPQIVVSFEEKEERPKSKPKYPNARTVFSWFPKPQKSWEVNTTELAHAELLFERGETQVKGGLRFVSENKEDPFCPTVVKPSDLERKWLDLFAYKNKNGL